MCGIFGWSWGDKRPTVRQRETLATVLGTMNDRRAGKGWGWYRPDVDRIVRGDGSIGQVARVLSSASLVLAHTRWPTVGAEKKENAHPFVHGSVIGAHNGGIWNYRDLNQKHGRTFEVDSQHLIAHIAEGKETTELEGYGTVEWVEQNDPAGKGIFLCQLTGSGDLAIRRTPFGIVWSSEDEHLELALELSHLKGEELDFKSGEVMWTSGGRLFDAQRTLKLSERKSWSGGSYGHWWDSELYRRDSTPTPTPPTVGGDWSELRTSDTCDWCNAPVMVDEMVYTKDDEQLCAECRDYLLTEAKDRCGS